MKIKRATNSLAASKYLPIAIRMAAAIKSRVAGKKRVLDGVIVEGRKVGDLRMARCIEIPGALTSFAHYGFIASTGLEIPEHADTVVPSRDVFDPSFHAQLQGPIVIERTPGLIAVAFGMIGGGRPSVVSGGIAMADSSRQATSYLSTITTNPGLPDHVLRIDSTKNRYGPGFTYYIPSGLLFAKMGIEDGGFRASQYSQETVTNNYYPSHFHPVTVEVDGDPVTMLSFSRTSFNTLTPGLNKQTVQFYFGVTRIDLGLLAELLPTLKTADELAASSVLTAHEIDIDTLLPDWAQIKTVRTPAPNPEGHAEMVSARVMSISDAMVDGDSIVLAINYSVEVDGSHQNPDGTTTQVEPVRVVAAGRLVIDAASWSATSLDFYDINSVGRKNSAEAIDGGYGWKLDPEVPDQNNETYRPNLDVFLLPDKRLVSNGMIFKRTAHIETVAEVALPISEMKVNGITAFQYSDGVGAAYPPGLVGIWWGYSDRRFHGQSVERISNTTAAATWYKPQDEPGFDQGVGVLFTDGARFKSFPLGVTVDVSTQGSIYFSNDMTLNVQLTCPQREVRSDGKLVMPSTIIASYWGAGGKKYVRVRKGPVWPEDMPEAADESSFWSEPLEVDSVPMRAFYYAGSQHMTSRHGAYYADKETD